MSLFTFSSVFFFFNDTATTEIYTLSLHDALPIYLLVDELPYRLKDGVLHIGQAGGLGQARHGAASDQVAMCRAEDRKSTRLNSSHANISYAVFCLKKKKNIID